MEPVSRHVRHQPPRVLPQPRPCWVACPQFRSQVNLSRLVRLAGSCGIRNILTTGKGKIDPDIARDAANTVHIDVRRSLPPRLKELRSDGFRLVGLEQTTRSECLYTYHFPRELVLVIGHERHGLADELLCLMDDLIEIPVYGLPYSYNVVTAATMALYEYCKQHQ